MINVSPFHQGDRVVAYCRYSEGEEQGLKNQSTEEQAEAIRRFCESQGLDLVRIYADPFVSGRSVKGRDHYLEMLSDLLHDKKNKAGIAGIIAWDFERIHRNFNQAQLDAARLRMAGYKIFSLQQPIADEGPFAHVLEAMYFASAQNQSDMISADVKRALQNNFQKYKVIPRSCIPDGWIGVPVDMGFFSNGEKRIGYKAEPDPDLAPKIRQAIGKRLEGATLDEMKAIIGGPFTDKTRDYMRRMMLKPLLYGQITYGGTTMEDYCEPIIDKDTYYRLQLYNELAPKEYVRPLGHFSKNRPLLSGLLYCGICGKKAFLNRRTAKGHVYETYYCNDKHVGIRREILDSLVIEKGIELLSDENYRKDVGRIVAGLRMTSGAPDRSAIEAEIKKIDRKISRISDAIEDSDETPKALVKRLTELEKERAALASELESPLVTEDLRDKILSEADRIRLAILEVLKNEKSTTEDLRNALSIFIHSVVIYPGSKVLIRHTLPGFSAQVVSSPSGKVMAPPEEGAGYSQLLECWCSIKTGRVSAPS